MTTKCLEIDCANEARYQSGRCGVHDLSHGPTPRVMDLVAATNISVEVLRERGRQHRLWGEQNLPNGTGGSIWGRKWSYHATKAKKSNQTDVSSGGLTYRDLLWEEVCEAFAETDSAKLREELKQVAAVAVQWIEAIDRRGGRK